MELLNHQEPKKLFLKVIIAEFLLLLDCYHQDSEIEVPYELFEF